MEGNQIPDRIRLSNGLTRTDRSTFTQEELESAGYLLVDPPLNTYDNQKLTWNGSAWQIVEYTEEEIDERTRILWADIRSTRDSLLNQLDWRFLRYHSQVRLGIQPIDNIEDLDNYAQALRDITNQEDPLNITWPSLSINDRS